VATGARFMTYDLHTLQRGSVVVVSLNTAANIHLLDSTNLRAYKNLRSYREAKGGGLVKRSPHRILVPSTGRWYLTVDRFGLPAKTVRSKIAIEPPSSPVAKSASPPSSLANIRHEAPPNVDGDDGRVWDVFISHAGEDKAAVVRPLAEALRERGVEVWFDEFELKIGDSLRRKIDTGLARSKFGIVVLSRSFFAKGWPQYELDGIVSRSVSGEQTLLPIWHEITKDEVMAQSPSLVDKIARSTTQFTIEEIADEITAVVRPDDTVSEQDLVS
jgi:uncharacterized protein DUF1883/TIR domain-containing protein